MVKGVPSPSAPSDDGRGRVQAVDRAVSLLHAVAATAPEGRPGAELAAECGLNRATAWRLLATLEHHGLVERNRRTNRYTIGFALTRLGTAGGTESLVRRAHPVLARISEQTGETASLAVAGRTGLTYVDEVVPRTVLTARWLGRHVPIHATSAGKAFLAWLPAEEVHALCSVRLEGYTRTTRTDETRLRAELATIRERGYGISDGELEPDVFGVAAAALDRYEHPFAVVCLWGPKERFAGRFDELGTLVRHAADQLADDAA
ncbi:MAG TPA: IclR family transcriptional regulator [Segeticoccus sp.]|uniref:IclR family transcriptional regulator n=1 Tax=Segeticoccus sp. TaxID=2706531 RepID=UPI002D7F066E|nr:IclR family transcriptional regulator [Segeticoccus sp.]HET8599916.1 IclR family transcriptional regulator [Segeticoccus sp.]